MTRRGWLAAVLAAFLVVTVTSCTSEGEDDNSERDEEGNITEGGDVGVFALREGDCFAEPPTGNLEEVAAVPCDEPHDAEVIAVFELEANGDAAFPGSAEVNSQAQERCAGDLFEEYVGVPFNQSELHTNQIVPTEQGWEEADDREVICVAQSGDGSDLTESVRDANR